MGMFTQYNETVMLQQLDSLLWQGERIQAAVYCVFANTDFFGSRYPKPGYIAITDRNRLIGYRLEMIGDSPIEVSLDDLSLRVRVKNVAFGTQKQVLLEHMAGNQKKQKLKIQFAKKMAGSKFPNQEAYAELIAQKLANLM